MDIDKQIEYLKNFITEKRWERFNEVLNNRTRHLTIVLEDVFHEHNASAVLRSCDCFGIQDVHFIENRNEFKTNDEVAMGATQWLSIHRYREKDINNTEACFNHLRQQGYKIVVTSPHAKSVRIQDLNINQPLAIVFGAEKEGLTDYALQNADEKVFIPMYGFTESFNISVSVALCMYEIMNRLRASNINYHLPGEEKKVLLLQWLKTSIKDAEKILSRMQNIV